MSGKPQNQSQSGGVVLPPLRQRTAREEEALRQVVRKDLEGYCRPPFKCDPVRPPYKPGYQPSSSYAPWQFTPTGNASVSPLLGGQTPRQHQNTMLSSDGFASDATKVESEGDPQAVAKEAEARPPNELIKEEKEDDNKPEVKSSFSSKVESEEGYESSKTRYSDGTKTSKGEHTSTYKESGKPFKGKYDASSKIEQKIAGGSLVEKKDTDGFAQGSLNFANAQAQTATGMGMSDDWTGGNAGLSGTVGGSAYASLLEAEGSLNKDGFLSGKAGLTVLKAEATAQAKMKVGVYNGSPTAAVAGKLGVDLTAAEVKAGGGIAATPYRAGNFVVHTYNGLADWAGWDTRLEEIDKSWDWGIFLEFGGQASVGATAEIEGEAGALEDGKYGVRTRGKAALGVGGGLNLGIGLQRPSSE
ncbi:hypothetical protein N7E02_02305 (plasmid) [Aliirhizobium terrae]|uniref:hypothetical protein n=1 Tax=Terrirhizobium terrae TaxID=2926709 RepID=UPI002578F177|nr:hypothetical protein [Rhizobium sp. CC-CFT758]WJH37676.1 hypothetical protein N7E02_02305 [Rhizobium sp. CC-CFT758]